MICNLDYNTGSKIEKFKTIDRSYNTLETLPPIAYDPFITDAVHIYGSHYEETDADKGDGIYTFPFGRCTEIWLTWKDGDEVEQDGGTYIRATNTLMIDPYAFKHTGVVDVYIPYATSIETFNTNWVETTDHSADNYVYEQQCFSSDMTIHVNPQLYAYMQSHPEVWGNIMGRVYSEDF